VITFLINLHKKKKRKEKGTPKSCHFAFPPQKNCPISIGVKRNHIMHLQIPTHPPYNGTKIYKKKEIAELKANKLLIIHHHRK